MQDKIFQNWQKKSAEKQKLYKQYLQRATKNTVLKQLPELHEEAFEKINCLECAACCKHYSPRFKTPDIKRISKVLQLKEMLKSKDLFQSLTIADYIFTKCLLFAKVNLPETEFRLYQKLFDIIHQQLEVPDILIYLHSPVNKLQQNIKKRKREYEQNIPDDYLFNLQETYTSYIKQHNIKTIFIDASNADFLGNEQHFQVVLNALEKDQGEGQSYYTLP